MALATIGCATALAPWVALGGDAPVIPLPDAARKALAPLGAGIVLGALPATPITDAARLRHLEAGTWRYRLLEGPERSKVQTVVVEPVPADDSEASWRVVTEGEAVQRLRVTTTDEVVKLSQDDLQSNRYIVYRPGIVLEPGMQPGQTKTVKSGLATYKSPDRKDVEFNGSLEYRIHYIGAYRVKTPAGTFDARLLEHEYTMKIGPAKAEYRSYGLYADDVGNVAEVSSESVRAVLVYHRSSEGARVLLSYPEGP